MKNKILQIFAAGLLLLPLAATALRDPNYSQSQQLLEAEGIQVESFEPVSVPSEELLALEEASAPESTTESGETTAVEPSTEPSPEPSPEPSTSPEPAPAPSPEVTEPEVLGASTERDDTDSYLKQLRLEMTELRAAAAEANEKDARLSELEKRLNDQNVIFVIFVFALVLSGVYTEIRFSKLSRLLAKKPRR